MNSIMNLKKAISNESLNDIKRNVINEALTKRRLSVNKISDDLVSKTKQKKVISRILYINVSN